jgi:hypothetical protein
LLRMFECGSVKLDGEFGRKRWEYLCELNLECLLVRYVTSLFNGPLTGKLPRLTAKKQLMGLLIGSWAVLDRWWKTGRRRWPDCGAWDVHSRSFTYMKPLFRSDRRREKLPDDSM